MTKHFAIQICGPQTSSLNLTQTYWIGICILRDSQAICMHIKNVKSTDLHDHMDDKFHFKY